MTQINQLIGLKREARKAGWYKDWTPADEHALLQGCWFDEAAGMAPIVWIESFCHLAQGEWAGQLVELSEWQKEDLFLPLFGWMNADGYRRYRELYLTIAKKNGKSTICAALELYGLVGDGEPGAEVYTAATTKDQTKNVHNPVAEMVRKSPYLKKLLKISDHTKTISFGSNAWIQALSSDAESSEGKNAHIVVVDEVHVHKNRRLYASLKYAGAARRQPIFAQITTRGDDIDSLCGSIDEHAQRVINGDSFDVQLLPLIYAPSPKDDPLDIETARKGNPMMGITINEETFIRERDSAYSKGGADWGDFRRYRLNLWTEAGQAEYDIEAWKKLPKLDESEIEGQPCWVGLDLSAKEDLTAVSCVWVNQDKTRYRTKTFQWCPSDKIQSELDEGRKLYKEWADSGELRVIEGPIIRQKVVQQLILEIHEQYGIQAIVFDRHRADDMIAELVEDYFIEAIEFSQGFGSFDYATTELAHLIADGAIEHDHNRCFTWQLSNVVCKESLTDGKKRPIKREKKQGKTIRYKIDGPVAMIMALDKALREDAPGSLYDQGNADPLAAYRK